MSTKDEILGCLAREYANRLVRFGNDFFEGLREVRLRVDRPIALLHSSGEYFLSDSGLVRGATGGGRLVASAEGIAQCVELLCNHSPHAYENELAAGFITIAGGHRVGLVGRAILEGGRIRGLRNIGGLSVRVAHELPGCADGLADAIIEGARVLSTLLVSGPGLGKTTLLRDIVRQLSEAGMAVGLVDERSELAACYRGIPQNDVGLRTDVLDACPKAEGMMMLLRNMSPAVIAADEIGRVEDAAAIAEAANSGVGVVCTAHGHSAAVEDVWRRPGLRGLEGIFERYVVLDGIGDFRLLDRQGSVLMQRRNTNGGIAKRGRGGYNFGGVQPGGDILWKPGNVSNQGAFGA